MSHSVSFGIAPMLGSGEGNGATSAAVVYGAAELSHRAAVLGALEKTAAFNYMSDEDEDWSETDDEEESDDCSFSDESSASSAQVYCQKDVRLCVSTNSTFDNHH